MQKLQDGPIDGVAEESLPDSGDAPPGTYRIGGVSRLTGVPVTTLRVWETRHGAFSPQKSSGKHRLYTEHDVLRARLLRQLSAAGHSVGGIARLPLPELQRLAPEARGTVSPALPQPTRAASLVVVGAAIAARMGAPGWQLRHLGEAPQVQEVFADLDAATAAPDDGHPAADILLVRLDAIQPATADLVARAVAHLRVTHAIVLYSFAAEPSLDAMRAEGLVLRREPVSDGELADLIRSLSTAEAADAASAAVVPPRRFSDALLAQVASGPTGMLCECPRHIADLIGQLAAFEAYSRQCLDASAEDAHVHAHLRAISGVARAQFEQALQSVLQHAGVPLQADLPAAS